MDRLAAFQEFSVEARVPLADEKMEGPATSLSFLGILLDTVQDTSSLPLDKLPMLKWLISKIRGRKKCTFREIQSVWGHLNFACRVVFPGWTFCSYLAWATVRVKAPHHYTCITQGIQQDLAVGEGEFLEQFNGVST